MWRIRTRRALELDPFEPSVCYGAACVYCLAGEADKAVDCMERALQTGFGQKAWLEQDSEMALIHGDPRFRAILDKMTR